MQKSVHSEASIPQYSPMSSKVYFDLPGFCNPSLLESAAGAAAVSGIQESQALEELLSWRTPFPPGIAALGAAHLEREDICFRDSITSLFFYH